jgi:hypothetical protein
VRYTDEMIRNAAMYIEHRPNTVEDGYYQAAIYQLNKMRAVYEAELVAQRAGVVQEQRESLLARLEAMLFTGAAHG